MTDNFAKKAADWDSPQKIKMASNFITELFKQVTLNSSEKVLEIGAGTGLVGLQLLPQLKSVVFVDTSAAMLDVLKRKIKPDDKVEVIHGDALAYRKKDIDLVISNMAFHHILDIEIVLNHLYDVTKDGAKLVIGDLVTEDGSFHNFTDVPHKGFDIKEFAEKFKKAGFKNVNAHIYNTLRREREDGKVHEYDQFILYAEK